MADKQDAFEFYILHYAQFSGLSRRRQSRGADVDVAVVVLVQERDGRRTIKSFMLRKNSRVDLNWFMITFSPSLVVTMCRRSSF